MAIVEAEVVIPRVASARPPRRSRNLIVLRAGDRSLHGAWLAAARRDFDVFVSYFGRVPGRHAEGADFYEMRPGPKWPCIADLVREHHGLVAAYDCVWFPDDDLAADPATLDRMFAFFHAFELNLAQPALTHDSYCTWRTLRQDPGCHLRFNRFVEIMAPIFSREALRICAPSFSESPSGWGLDWLWPRLCQQAGLERMAVIDATPVRHTRPCGGELYARHPEMDPRADAQRVLRKYGLHDVRAEAKYSFARRIREVPLPAALRLLYGLRKLHGRRKHRPRD
ncbi:MAG: DUF707 domain-containing protein [Steroidobacteraceae bacterium]|nr:DUF707 domain-containing protein [Steroidobacteraceae bacterium]